MVLAGVDRAAVLAPGGEYGTDGPLLMYAGLAVERRRGYAHRIVWAPPDPQRMVESESHAWVNAQVAAAIDETVKTTGIAAPVVIGKSIGTLAAQLAADRGLPAVWLTPLLTDEMAVAALRRASAPCLLVGGTADRWWDGQIARSITPHVVEVPAADHGMIVPGELSASAAVLGQVATAVEQFLDQVVWL
jgi:hypothetical protein